MVILLKLHDRTAFAKLLLLGNSQGTRSISDSRMYRSELPGDGIALRDRPLNHILKGAKCGKGII